ANVLHAGVRQRAGGPHSFLARARRLPLPRARGYAARRVPGLPPAAHARDLLLPAEGGSGPATAARRPGADRRSTSLPPPALPGGRGLLDGRHPARLGTN